MAALSKVRPGDLIRAEDWNALIDHVVALEGRVVAEPAPEPERGPDPEPKPAEPTPEVSTLDLKRKATEAGEARLTYRLLPAADDVVGIEVELPTALGDRVSMELTDLHGDPLDGRGGSEVRAGTPFDFVVVLTATGLLGGNRGIDIVPAPARGVPASSALRVAVRGDVIDLEVISNLKVSG